MDMEARTAGAPSTSEVTPDGGVTKELLEEGAGEAKPAFGSKCFVLYTLFVGDEEVFSTAGEDGDGPPAELVVPASGSDPSAPRGLRGLLLCLPTMRKKEKCKLSVSPEYGYGAEGNFSFPHVPPSSDLVYVVELVGWLDPEVEKRRGELERW